MVRVLLCGDLKGRLKQLCDQVTKLHAKLDAAQHFQAVFCIGDFSCKDMDWDVKPPVPVYFIDSGPAAGDLINENPQGDEIKPGLHFLGHYGVTTVAGLTVAYLSGRYRADLFEVDPLASMGEHNSAGGSTSSEAPAGPGPSWEDIRAAEQAAEVAKTQLYVDGCFYTPLAIERLVEDIGDSNGIDLLLTSEWPAGCLGLVPKAEREGVDKNAVQQCSSPAVAEVVVAAEPKYHAVGMCGVFWRRPPWMHERRGEIVASTGALKCGVCRLVALGSPAGPPPELAAKPKPYCAPEGLTSAQNPAPTAKVQKWLHGLDVDPTSLPSQDPTATACPWTQHGVAASSKEEGPMKWAPSFGMADPEERRRWMQKFGIKPEEMQEVVDSAKKAQEAKEKAKATKKRKSLYETKKDREKKKGGAGQNDTYASIEKRIANGRSAGNSF
eukprot:gnl/TRDRNA2_/TRDRNA2_86201_c0_seq1.p1 gnl/TRDRNA2_/TRDRNA2_86201_c0~~gnl/TRDRNA2_/TRDRNA2_86201_c0_seq1.p1  ORF type:complete len:440 (+),score=99.86 gnl/TRDRNA2_/TRDRNA2_86201_c0_seq1:134-1453(+)